MRGREEGLFWCEEGVRREEVTRLSSFFALVPFSGPLHRTRKFLRGFQQEWRAESSSLQLLRFPPSSSAGEHPPLPARYLSDFRAAVFPVESRSCHILCFVISLIISFLSCSVWFCRPSRFDPHFLFSLFPFEPSYHGFFAFLCVCVSLSFYANLLLLVEMEEILKHVLNTLGFVR